MIIALLVTWLLVIGIRESATANNFVVMLKVAIVLFVVIVGAFYVDTKNWVPFAPYGYTGISFFGQTLFGQTAVGGEPLGVLAGAAVIFFAYIGFDSVSTHAEEAKNPQKDVPIGIIWSLVVCTILYIAVAAVLTGMVPYKEINIETPVSDAFRRAGLPWARYLISAGAVAGITSVLLVMMLSQPRVWLAMARDGMVSPSFFGAIHAKYRTPVQGHHPHRHPGGHRRRAAATAGAGRPHQHRHPVRLRRGVRGGPDHAADASRRRTSLPGARSARWCPSPGSSPA